MIYEQIQYNVSDCVATVTLARPDKLNAWTMRMDEEVRHAMHAAAADETVAVIVLTGAGRGFCAGADMELLASITADGGAAIRQPLAEGARAGASGFARRYSYFPSIGKPI